MPVRRPWSRRIWEGAGTPSSAPGREREGQLSGSRDGRERSPQLAAQAPPPQFSQDILQTWRWRVARGQGQGPREAGDTDVCVPTPGGVRWRGSVGLTRGSPVGVQVPCRAEPGTAVPEEARDSERGAHSRLGSRALFTVTTLTGERTSPNANSTPACLAGKPSRTPPLGQFSAWPPRFA